jgi:2-(1,2-epoxy-1,2-dihydrophenyl)acetyl-CoA isomerase
LDSIAAVGDDEMYRQYETVNLYSRGPGAKIELNRPERLNAWNDQFSHDLLAAIREVTDNPDIRAVVVTGAGRAFSSGADLKEAAERADGAQLDVYRILTERYHPIMTGIRLMPKPVIAAVNGPCAGIGLSLALACDLVVAAASAFFQLAFINIGLVPDGGSSLFVPSRVGFTRAAELAMLGERLDAETALDWGLINRVWPDGEFGEQVNALLDRLASGATKSYAGTKRQLNRWLFSQMDAQLEFEAGIQREMAASGDFAEGLAAFAAKRPPRFTGA